MNVIQKVNKTKAEWERFTEQEHKEIIKSIYESDLFHEDLPSQEIYDIVEYSYYISQAHPKLLLLIWSSVCNKLSTIQNIANWHVADIPADPVKGMCEVLADIVEKHPEFATQANEVLEKWKKEKQQKQS